MSVNVERNTNETKICVKLDIYGSGRTKIDTGIPFFDHMVDSLARFALFDLVVECKADLAVEDHHMIEDVAIVLAEALLKATGERKGINRIGYSILPMDDAVVMVSIDLSRSYFQQRGIAFSKEKFGSLSTENIAPFFESLALNAKMTLYMNKIEGTNDHHIAEACFKALGCALKMAVAKDERMRDALSTKGVL
ncbi:MAG: imidazoleglycerol-phosphate dehydratase HisB [archaeon]